MKKQVLIFALILGGFSFTSCTKDYVCSCDDSFGGTIDVEAENVNKSDAKELQESCESSDLCTWKEL
jgi:hypothetical protein